jgi:branched-chain amino acid transport system permease protein
MSAPLSRILVLHLGLIAILFILNFVLPDYLQLRLTRIMLLSIYAMGYNLLFGYAGLLSLGHAMFFGTGLYAAAMGVSHLGLGVPAALGFALVVGLIVALIIGAIALRTSSVAFMIVTLMFAQAFYLATLYFGDYTRGDEGIILGPETRRFTLLGLAIDLTDVATRYWLAWGFFAFTLIACLILVRSPIGRVLVAIRENEARTALLGYDVQRHKLVAVVLSGGFSALAGAGYALMFAYAGSTMVEIGYSINPLLWTLVGGAGTLLGPFVGTAIMFSLVDLASDYAAVTLAAIGVVLIAIVLFFPHGLVGAIRRRWLPWLP